MFSWSRYKQASSDYFDVNFNYIAPVVLEIWKNIEKSASVAIERACLTVRRHHFQKIFSYFVVS